MPDSITARSFLNESVLFAFLFTFARVGGIIAFLPLPGLRGTPEPIRVILALAFTAALAPLWMTRLFNQQLTLPYIVAGVLVEISIGLAIGVTVGIVLDVFQCAAQIVSLQAGFSYASTVDPTSGADSPVLVMLSQLSAALIFVTSGADQAFFRLLAQSIALHPPGNLSLAAGANLAGAGNAIFHFAALILISGLRLAAPMAVLFLLSDILLSVFGRLQPQLQLTTLSFPLKTGGAIFLFASLVRLYPRFFEQTFSQALRLMEGLLQGPLAARAGG